MEKKSFKKSVPRKRYSAVRSVKESGGTEIGQNWIRQNLKNMPVLIAINHLGPILMKTENTAVIPAI